MFAIDTDAFAVYHTFYKDPRYDITKRLLEKLNSRPKAVTIFNPKNAVAFFGNLLELCDILTSAAR